MSERRFKLINGNGEEFRLNQYGYAWLHDPDGLGWAPNVENVSVGNAFVTIKQLVEAPQPTGEIIFIGYEAYQKFLDFIQVGNTVLAYMPISTWRYLDCVVQIEKSEIKPENDRLVCPVTFIARSYWYESVQVYTATGEVLDSDKKYAYNYEYTYGDTGSGTVAVHNGQLPSFFKLSIIGEAINPRYRVFKGGEVYKEGRILTTIPAGRKLVVNTHPAAMEIAEYTLADEFVQDLYGASDFTTERIFELPSGTSVVAFLDDSLNVTQGYVEVKKRV